MGYAVVSRKPCERRKKTAHICHPGGAHFQHIFLITYILYITKKLNMGRTRYLFPIYMEGTQPGFAKRPVLVCAPFSWQSVAPSAVRGFVGSYLLLPGSSGSQSIDGLYFYPCRGAGRACPKLVACIVRVRMARPYILRRIVSLRPRHGSVAGRQVSIWRMLLSRIPVPSGASSRSVYHSYCWKTWRSRRGSRLWRVSSRPSLEQR